MIISPELTFRTDEFRTYIQFRNSKLTALKYGQAVDRFHVFCQRQGLSLDRIPPGVLSLFADALLHDGLKISTVRTLVSGVSRYLDWCRKNGRDLPVLSNPDLPKAERALPNTVSQEVLTAFLAIASRLHEPVRTSLLLMPFCGLRSFELVNLRLTDISRVVYPATSTRHGGDMLAFSVIGKGRKHRKVPLIADGRTLLINFLQTWRKQQSGPYLFPMSKGSPISPRTLRHYIKVIRERLGATRFTPHTLRRVYLNALHRSGIDIPTLTLIAGHESVQTTMDHYLAIEDDQIAGAVSGVRLVAKGPYADSLAGAQGKLADFFANDGRERPFIPDLPPLPDDPNDE